MIQDILDVLCYASNPLTIGITTEGSNGEGNEDQVNNLITMDDVEGALDGGTRIELGELEELCPLYFCILEGMLEGNEEGNWFSDLICNLDENGSAIYNFEISNQITSLTTNATQNVAGDGTVFKEITTSVPSFLCNEVSPILPENIASMFIHETMHAHYLDMGLSTSEGKVPFGCISQNENSTCWINIVADYHNIPVNEVNPNHHYLFYQNLFSNVQTALWELNGNLGDINDYEYMAHVLINTQNLATSQWAEELGLTGFNLSDYENDWQENIVNVFDFNIYNCLN